MMTKLRDFTCARKGRYTFGDSTGAESLESLVAVDAEPRATLINKMKVKLYNVNLASLRVIIYVLDSL